MAVGVVRVKPGVVFTTISPAGFRLLAAIDAVAMFLGYDLTITSACDGTHSGTSDPHHAGSAFDIRTKTLAPSVKDDALRLLLEHLAGHGETLQPVSIGFATTLFYAQIEDRGGENEHIHCQLRTGRTYPPILRTEAPKVTTV